jgi:hypothetical protein
LTHQRLVVLRSDRGDLGGIVSEDELDTRNIHIPEMDSDRNLHPIASARHDVTKPYRVVGEGCWLEGAALAAQVTLEIRCGVLANIRKRFVPKRAKSCNPRNAPVCQ